MALSQVSLTLSARANLNSLQDTSSLLALTQNRLATGKKVNSALDDANAYFAARGFVNRASDLSRVKDTLGTALQTVKAATNALESIEKLVTQLQGITTSALATTDSNTRSGYNSQYNVLRDQIDSLVNDASFNGTNLVKTNNTLVVKFNEDNTSTLTITGVTATVTGLGIVAGAFTTADATINSAVSLLQTALTNLRTFASNFGNNYNIIQTRQDFTSNLISNLTDASDKLTLADLNEEGANLQALQARSQLGVVSLGISGQQAQAILRLF